MTNLIRQETRNERYEAKKGQISLMNVSIATINIETDENIGFLARAVGCFGAHSLHIVGKLPEYNDLRRYSGGVSNHIQIKKHSNPVDFLKFCRNSGYFVVSAELTDGAVDLQTSEIPMDLPIMLVVGHETSGVPAEILHRSDLIVKIPMPGIGYCLNVAQTGNILLYELRSRFDKLKLTR